MLIKNMLEDLGDAALETPIPIPNVSPFPPRPRIFSLVMSGFTNVLGTGQ